MRERKYVVAPAPPGYRGTALWTVTDDGQLDEMVDAEPQDHGPGSTAIADLEDALAVYRAACAVLAPDEATVERLADVLHAAQCGCRQGKSGMHPRGVKAVLAALADTSAQARQPTQESGMHEHVRDAAGYCQTCDAGPPSDLPEPVPPEAQARHADDDATGGGEHG